MDYRLIVILLTLTLSLTGSIALTILGFPTEAERILTLVALPSLTFVLGLGSELNNKRIQ